MFKPILLIKIDASLKTYTLTAIITVPNGCYSNGGTALGIPDGQVAFPEAETVILNIIKHEGPCTEGIRTLVFKLERIPLTIGKSSIIAYAIVGDEIVGVQSSPIPGAPQAHLMESAAPQASGIQIASVNAWTNAMPGGDPRLIARVNVHAPCTNYEYSFIDKGPFGFTGKTLLVEMKAALSTACDRTNFDGHIRFEKMLSDANEFDSIAVAFEGDLYFDPLEIIQ